MKEEYRLKNQMLYLWEGIACIFVVLIHCRFPGNVGNFVETIARFAVPLFFAVSGYFWTSGSENITSKALRKVKKIAVIFVSALIVYSIYKTLTGEFNISNLTISDIGKLFLFNSVDFVCGPLWFLLALIYCYLIFVFIDRINCYKILPIMSFLLLGIHYFLRIIMTKNACAIMGHSLSEYIFYRNWLMLALPCFSIGYLIKADSERIKDNCTIFIGNIMILGGAALSILERLVLHIPMEFYIGSMIMVVGIFVLAIVRPITDNGKGLQYIGENCVLPIYIIHPLVMYILRRILFKLNLSEEQIVLWILPIVVVSCSVTIAVIYLKASKKLKEKRV